MPDECSNQPSICSWWCPNKNIKPPSYDSLVPAGCPTWDNSSKYANSFGYWLTENNELTNAGYQKFYSKLYNVNKNYKNGNFVENCKMANVPTPLQNAGWRHEGGKLTGEGWGAWTTVDGWSNNGPYDYSVIKNNNKVTRELYGSSGVKSRPSIKDLKEYAMCDERGIDGAYGYVWACADENKCGSGICKSPPKVAQYRDSKGNLKNCTTGYNAFQFSDRYKPPKQKCEANWSSPKLHKFGNYNQISTEPISSENSVGGKFTLYCPNWAMGDYSGGIRTFINGDTGPWRSDSTKIMHGWLKFATGLGPLGLIVGNILSAVIAPTGVRTNVHTKLTGKDLSNTEKVGYQFRAIQEPFCSCNGHKEIRYGDLIQLRNEGQGKYMTCGGGSCALFSMPGKCTKNDWQTFQILPGKCITYYNYSKIGDMVCYGDVIQLKILNSGKFVSAADEERVITCTKGDQHCKGSSLNFSGGDESFNYNMMIMPPTGSIFQQLSNWNTWEGDNLQIVKECQQPDFVKCWAGSSLIAQTLCKLGWFIIIPIAIIVIIIVIFVIKMVIKAETGK